MFCKKHFAVAVGLMIAGMVGGLLVDGELKIRGDGMKLPEGGRAVVL